MSSILAINSEVDAVFAVDRRFYKGTILQSEGLPDGYMKVRFEDGISQITHVDFIKTAGHSSNGCKCCTQKGLIRKILCSRPINHLDSPIEDPNLVMKKGSSFFVTKNGSITVKNILCVSDEGGSDLLRGGISSKNVLVVSEEAKTTTNLMTKANDDDGGSLVRVGGKSAKNGSVVSVEANPTSVRAITLKKNKSRSNSELKKDLEHLLASSTSCSTLWKLIEGLVVEPLKEEISESHKAIKILQSRVVDQQEQILAFSKEKKLTNEILMNLKSEISILKKQVISAVPGPVGGMELSRTIPVDLPNSARPVVSAPAKEASLPCASVIRKSTSPGTGPVKSKDVSACVAKPKTYAAAAGSIATPKQQANVPSPSRKSSSSAHRHVIVKRVGLNISNEDVITRIKGCLPSLEIKAMSGEPYKLRGNSLRSVFLTVLSTPIKPNIDMLLNSAKNWSLNSWSVERFRSWKDFQKARGQRGVSSLVGKINGACTGEVTLEDMRASLVDLLPKQKFGSGKQTQKN
jgi:hypothetical protein